MTSNTITMRAAQTISHQAWRWSPWVMAAWLALSATACRRAEQAPRPPDDKAAASSLPAEAASSREPGEIPLPGPESLRVIPNFSEWGAQAGLHTRLYGGGPKKVHLLESTGSGCAWIDYDEDGLVDIFLLNAWLLSEGPPRSIETKGRSALYRNLGDGKFTEVTDQAGLGDDSWGCGVAAADYDNDGHVDLYVTNFGVNRLYRNLGNGRFEEVAQGAGVAATGWSTGAAFFDADGDGWLDLYVAKYVDCTWDDVLHAELSNSWRDRAKVMVGPFGLRGGRDQFFHNNGDGTFRDATDEVGMTDLAESYGLGVLASDLDLDGDIDVYVANDSNTNFLYRNEGNGKFTEIGGWCGAGLTAEGRPQAGMGVDAADFDGDGKPDIVVTNFAQDYCTVYQNDGNLFFTDISAALRMKEFTYEPVKWGCAWFDDDNDGDVDLVIVNGHIYPQVDDVPELKESYAQWPTLLQNIGGGFVNVSRQAGPGMQWKRSARGVAVADFDNDGRLDLLVSAIDSTPLLIHNETASNGHWLKLRLLNVYGSPAIGALAKITAAGKTQLRELRSGSTYCSQHEMVLHVGLGVSGVVDQVEVRWPDGQVTTATTLEADTTVTLQAPPRR